MLSNPEQNARYAADRRVAAMIAVYAPAVLIAWATLYFSGAAGDSAWRTPVSPFGWHVLTVLHVLAVFPVAALAAAAAVRALSGWPTALLVAAICTIGALIVVWTVSSDGAVGLALEKVRAAFTARWGIRVLWSFLLVFPWCVAACRLTAQSAHEVGRSMGVATWAMALIVAGGLPMVFTLNTVRQQTTEANQYLAAGRFWKAAPLIDALGDVGSTRPVESPAELGRSVSPAIARQELAAEIERIERETRQPLPSTATVEERVARARSLAAIGRLDAARAAIVPAAENGSAAMMLAVVLEEQGQWEASHGWYRTAARLWSESDDPQAMSNWIAAYDGLAKTARDLERHRDAEAAYREAIEASPASEAYFQFQLGRHYQLGGRPLDALAAFRRAAELSPRQFALDGPLAAPHIRALRQETPSCVFPLRGGESGSPVPGTPVR
jgi:hypothetical protein